MKSELRLLMHPILVTLTLSGSSWLVSLGLLVVNTTNFPVIGLGLILMSFSLAIMSLIWYFNQLYNWFRTKAHLKKNGIKVSFFKCYGLSFDKTKEHVTSFLSEYSDKEDLIALSKKYSRM